MTLEHFPEDLKRNLGRFVNLALPHTLEHFLGIHGLAVPEFLVIQVHHERKHFYSMLCHQFLGKIGSAVGYDFDGHSIHSPSSSCAFVPSIVH
ncbi:hypothetical protein D3C76_1534130 [compost metagenome]